MAGTNRTRRGRTNPAKTDKGTYGSELKTLDRMQEVWALRIRGYSFRAIAAQMGISPNTAWRDCKEAPDGVALMDDTSIARSQLLGGHRILLNHLLSEIEEQRQNGQRVVELAADGTPLRTTVKPMDAKLIGEAGRCLDRAARLLGLLDGPIEGSGGSQVTNITLAAPSDGATFEQTWANADAAVDVPAHSATEQPAEAALSPSPSTGGDTPV